MRWLLRIAINAVAIWVATAVVPGVHLTAQDTTHKVIAFAVVGALFGIVNTVVRPVIRFFTFPFILLSLGLLLIVINALMLTLVAWLSDALGIDFDPGPFWWSTVGAAIVVSLVSMILGLMFGDRKGHRPDDHRPMARYQHDRPYPDIPGDWHDPRSGRRY